MTRFRFCAVAVTASVLLVAAAPSHAQAQQQQQQQGQRGRRGGRGGGRGVLGLVSTPEVQKELKMEQPQIDLVAALATEARDPQARQQLQSLSAEERTARFAAMRADQEKKVGAILDAKQMKRLKQLELQQAGIRALDQKEVADELKLTADQKTQVHTIVQGERDAQQAAFGQRGAAGANAPRPSREDRQAAFQKMQETRTADDAKLAKVLTPAQTKQFEAMKGDPFTFPQRGRGRRGQPATATT